MTGRAAKPCELQQRQHLLDASCDRVALPRRASSARSRCCRRRSCAATARTTGTSSPCRAFPAAARDVAAVDADAPGLRRHEAGDRAQQRGLAAAGAAEQRDELAARDVEGDVGRARACRRRRRTRSRWQGRCQESEVGGQSRIRSQKSDDSQPTRKSRRSAIRHRAVGDIVPRCRGHGDVALRQRSPGAAPRRHPSSSSSQSSPSSSSGGSPIGSSSSSSSSSPGPAPRRMSSFSDRAGEVSRRPRGTRDFMPAEYADSRDQTHAAPPARRRLISRSGGPIGRTRAALRLVQHTPATTPIRDARRRASHVQFSSAPCRINAA